ncbi:cardiolipin synthase [Metabacillus sp. GX 13764]|uniref:cardiolipin synthase n=1 Tax=Metabacillus kandeliae TaxID=2900151 RepID=UPI001E58B7A8|nr:cardiolipin synthase [Metabacillus kandeliae]MCD7034979.1 cardiolipin synthase [Metabacillus kandeliae]
MKNFIQVIIFTLCIAAIVLVTKNFWSGWIVTMMTIIFTLSIIFIGVLIFLENRHPTQTLTWLVVLGAFPLVGFFFYLFFGRNVRKKRLFEKKALIDKKAFSEVQDNLHRYDEQIAEMPDHQQMLFKLSQKLGHTPISFSSQTQILTNGDETFEAIIREIKKAKNYIHLEYYIVRHDRIGLELQDALIEKAREGVDIRFLYDSVGSWKLSKKYIGKMTRAGIKMIPFLPVKLPFLSNKINFRNHRKIVVVDGETGFMGGLNVGDEYLGRDKHFGFWRDTHMFISGEAVRTLEMIFLQDWFYMTGDKLSFERFLHPVEKKIGNTGGVQLIAGGPDNKWEVIKNLFFSMIISAEKSIWIASPYFVPDEDILSAIRVAALSGVDVRVLIPQRPDKRLVFYASRSYFPELLEAGARIFEYKKGFMHSKIIIIDGELASIGTANMDMRSFHLNFEVNAFLYKTASTQTLVQEYENDLEDSAELLPEAFEKRPFYKKVFESFARLLSPLL